MIGPHKAYAVDAEINPNLSFIGVKSLQTGEVRQFSNVPNLVRPLAALRTWWSTIEADRSLILSFNGAGYDNHLLRAMIVQEIDDAEMLFELSKSVIVNNKGWQRSGMTRVRRERAIDLFAIAGGRIGSLKEIAIKLGWPKLEELPFPFDMHLTFEQMQIVAAYNANDLGITARCAQVMSGAILARLAMQDDLGIDVTNDSDPRLAERVMDHRIFDGCRPIYSDKTEWRLDCRPIAESFHFEHPELQALQQRIANRQMHIRLVIDKRSDGSIEKSLEGNSYSDTVRVGGVTFTIGQGGLHSLDGPTLFQADSRHCLLDFDATSYYPAVILNHELAPSHLPRQRFLDEFRALRDRRLQAVANKALSDGLKISINSLFGKCGSPYSWLCDPIALISCTLYGQLHLLSAIDLLSGIEGVQVISCNTDGVTIRVVREIAEDVQRALQRWACDSTLTLKWTHYDRIARRSISDYIAGCIDEDGRIVPKGRGAYDTDPTNLRRKAVNQVVVDATQAFFMHDTPVADTIAACTDLTRFLDYFKCKSGYEIRDDQGVTHGSIARWYLSTQGRHLDKVRLSDGQRTQLQAAGALIVNDLPGEFPADLDRAAYVALAEKLIAAITDPATKPSGTTIPVNEMSAEQLELHQHNYDTVTADPIRCGKLELSGYQRDFAQRTSHGEPKGSGYDTMKSLLPRLWLSQAGALTRGDLLWCAQAICDGDDYFDTDPAQRRTLTKMVDWVASLSPFPVPTTLAEKAQRAVVWAREKVTPCKHPRKMWHRSSTDSSFVSRTTIALYDKSHNDYRLCCGIAAAGVRHGIEVTDDLVMRIVGDVATHLDLALQAQHDADNAELSEFEKIKRRIARQQQTENMSRRKL